ncbi:hypothetical protein SBBP1_490034 [Burkholderiales bacterium]|nr:hypothetical protein SBBP1_490034 [Burkholderiales bacterium]
MLHSICNLNYQKGVWRTLGIIIINVYLSMYYKIYLISIIKNSLGGLAELVLRPGEHLRASGSARCYIGRPADRQ